MSEGPVAEVTTTAVSRWSRVVGPPQGRWGLGAATLTLLPIFLLVLLGVWMSAQPGGDTVDVTPLGALGAWIVVVSVALPWMWLAGVPMVASYLRGPGWTRSYGFVVSRRTLVWGLAGGLVTFVVIVVAVAVSQWFSNAEISASAADLGMQISGYPVAFAVFLLMVAFGAPFVEELAFRGLLWGAIVKRGWSPWVATAVAGVLFGAFHGEPSRLVALALGGVVLGVVRQYGGLGASMTAHAVVNVIGAVQLFMSTR
ncbi:MAG: type II CAAX endopeptidase family protein [Actinomycetes bacterium]